MSHKSFHIKKAATQIIVVIEPRERINAHDA